MKRSILILIVLFSIPALAQMDRFIIGAEHVSSFYDFSHPDHVPHSNAYWDTVKSLGLNYVGLKYFQLYPITPPYSFGDIPVSNITQDLDAANAPSRNIKVSLTNGFDRDAANNIYYPKRWVYQVEKVNGNTYNDFTYVPKGNSNLQGDALNASTHWNFAPPPSTTPNFLHLDPVTDTYGIIANSLREPNLQPDNLNYFITVRIRLPFESSFPDSGLLTVGLKGWSTYQRTIKASELGNNNWKEISVIAFYKTSSGPQPFGAPVPDSNAYNLTDKIGTVELQNYAPKQPSPPTSYDIEVRWNNTSPYNPVVDLDYVAINDETAKSLYNGDFNARVTDFANNYKNHSAVQNLMVWDEPRIENLFPIQRYDSILSVAGSTKAPLAYRHFTDPVNLPTKRFLYESGLPVLLSDVYPIPYYSDPIAHTLFPTPLGSPDTYTSSLQTRFQTPLIDELSDLITNSKIFIKSFWFAVQANYWPPTPPGDPDGHREPSAYEIRAMANLAVCYGAKGINYFLYSMNLNTDSGAFHNDTLSALLDDNSGNSMPRYWDKYHYPKWQTVKGLNKRLAAIGPELLTLTWQEAKSWHNGASVPTTWSGIVSAIDAKSGGVSDNPTYVETGHLTNASNADYLFVVNRRTLSSDTRDILISLRYTTTEWKVLMMDTVNTTLTTSDQGVLTSTFLPGEGKLFKILQQGPSIPQNVAVTSYGGDRWHPPHPKVSWSKNIPPSGLLAISGYEIYRSTQQSSPGTLIVTTSATDSFYVDTGVDVGSTGMTIYYRVKAKDVTGLHSGYSAQVNIGSSNFQQGNKQATAVLDTEKPTEFAFKQNYPNPFNPSTQIAFDLPQDVFVTIKIYNSIGQEVETLINEHKSVGRYSIEWNASNMPSGIYICKIQAGGFTESR